MNTKTKSCICSDRVCLEFKTPKTIFAAGSKIILYKAPGSVYVHGTSVSFQHKLFVVLTYKYEANRSILIP